MIHFDEASVKPGEAMALFWNMLHSIHKSSKWFMNGLMYGLHLCCLYKFHYLYV